MKGVYEDWQSVSMISRGIFSLYAHHSLAKGEQCLEKRVESGNRVLFAILALQSPSVKPDVPVRQLVNKIKESRQDGVEPVSLHLFLYEFDKRLTPSKDPSIHDVV